MTRERALWLIPGLTLVVAAWVGWASGVDGQLGLVVMLGLGPVYTALGTLTVSRRSGHRVGWLLIAIGIAVMVSATTELRLGSRPRDLDWLDYLALYLGGFTAFSVGIGLPICLLLFWFPDGRFQSPRWRWAGPAVAVIAILGLAASVFDARLAPGDGGWSVSNPIGVAVPADALIVLQGVGLVGLFGAGVLSLAMRYRRSDPVARSQIKWVLFSLAVTTAAFVVTMVGQRWEDPVMLTPIVLGFLGIPVSITIAIIRYRLFEIDKLISRTVGYGIVIAALTLVFLALTTLPSVLIGGMSESGVSNAPPALVAASTIAVAALFSPVRRWVLDRVDRRFNRSRFDAELVVDRFGESLGQETDLETLGARSVSVVDQTMQPNSIGIWIRSQD